MGVPAPCALVFAALSWATSASAEWLTARRDPQRTGASDGASNITKPAKYWRAYLGGVLGSFSFQLGDANADGELDVLYVAGGRMVLSKPDGETIWQTPNLEFVGIVDTDDIDHEGGREIVALGASQASLVDGRTGAVLWQQAPEGMGTIAAARLADFDGDGRVDLFLDGCGGCCAVLTQSPGVIYSFASGLSSPTPLGALPAREHCNAVADTVGDWDHDGTPDLLLPTSEAMRFVRGTGEVLGESATLGRFIGGARCEAADIDGVPGDEAVCIHNSIVGEQGSRHVFALSYRPTEQPRVKLLWDVSLAPAVNGDMRAPMQLITDLDGDGQLEIVASGKDQATWTTYVLDARTGQRIGELGGQLALAVTRPQAGSSGWLLASRGDAVSGFSYRRSAPQGVPRFTLGWELPERQLPTQQDRARGRSSGMNTSPVITDLDGDGLSEFVLQSTTEPTTLHAYAFDEGGVFETAAYALGDGVGVAALGVPAGLSTQARLGVSRDDGYVALLDGAFTTINEGREGKETLPGMRAGSYYTGSGGLFSFGRSPLAAPFAPPSAVNSVLVVDARGDLVRIDAAEASNVSPARPTWRAQDAFGASIAPAELSGDARVGCFRKRHPTTEPPSYVLASLSADGEQLAETSLEKPPIWDVLPGDLDGDGALDFAALSADATLATHVLAVRADGSLLWKQSLAATHGTSPAALSDWNGDGTDDVVLAINTARVHAGESGALLADGREFLAYFMPLVADVSGSGAPEATMQGGVYHARTLSHDLTTALWSGEEDRPYPYGALAASCPDGPKLVEGSLSFTSRLSLTALSGRAAGLRTTVVLASGGAFRDAAEAEAAGAKPGQLGDVAISADLSGRGEGPTALVGSTDGFLYAVDACTGALRWSFDFQAPVGAPIVADSDGDGRDDIVVSAADGYLYGLRQELLPAPETVLDIDVPRGVTDEDVDEITTHDTLYVAWSPVEGAESYEVAVVGAAGTYLTSPSWTRVGDVTRTAIRDLPLDDGAKFYVGVRAVSARGKSPDRPSDGVIVHLAPDDGGGGGAGGDGGAGGEKPAEVLLFGRGCACGVTGGGLGGGAAGLVAGAAALALRAARRPRARRRAR